MFPLGALPLGVSPPLSSCQYTGRTAWILFPTRSFQLVLVASLRIYLVEFHEIEVCDLIYKSNQTGFHMVQLNLSCGVCE